jgi:hypothetical protein
MSSEVIQVSHDDMGNIMENIYHGSLKFGANIFDPEGHDTK